MKRGSLFASLLVLLGIAAPTAARFGFPEPVTERARIVEDIYMQITVAGIIVFLFVMALLAFILIRYREGGKGRATYEKERDNLKAEMVWTVIPLVIMMWIGVISYQGLVVLDDMDGNFDHDNALVIDITASQYAWQAQYADSGATVLAVANADLEAIAPFYVPSDVPLHFRITAVDVIHSFNILGTATTVDAVPGQINDLLVAEGLPEGWYFTQCKENCMTAGHGYMQAQVISVPESEYTTWTEETLAGAAAGLEQVLPLEYTDGDVFQPLKGTQLAKGATAFVQVIYEGTAGTMDFTFNGETRTVNSGSMTTFEFEVAESGTFPIAAGDGQSIDLEAIDAMTLDVDLGAFVLEPASVQLQANSLYIINVENVHNAVHNLYIGMDGADGNSDAIWNTGNLANGQSEAILIETTEPVTLDMWCAVPGHYAAGMFGTVTIA